MLAGQRQALEILIREHDVLPLGVLVASCGLIPRHIHFVGGTPAALLEAGPILRVQQVERDILALCRPEQLHRDAYHPETDRPAPDRPCHAGVSRRPTARSRALVAAWSDLAMAESLGVFPQGAVVFHRFINITC